MSAGAVEAALCALAIHHGILPVNANLVERDPECDLDFIGCELEPFLQTGSERGASHHQNALPGHEPGEPLDGLFGRRAGAGQRQ